jgi:hypothetical protein
MLGLPPIFPVTVTDLAAGPSACGVHEVEADSGAAASSLVAEHPVRSRATAAAAAMGAWLLNRGFTSRCSLVTMPSGRMAASRPGIKFRRTARNNLFLLNPIDVEASRQA